MSEDEAIEALIDTALDAQPRRHDWRYKATGQTVWQAAARTYDERAQRRYLGIVLPREDAELIVATARDQRVSVSALIRTAIAAHLRSLGVEVSGYLTTGRREHDARKPWRPVT